MGENSKIEWCDNTFNPWEGCSKKSDGCKNCYALTRNLRFNAGANWGPGAPRRRTVASNWNQPRKWEREYVTNLSKLKTGETLSSPRVFCASLADWLDAEVPVAWRHDLLDLIDTTADLTWLLLTKRPELWRTSMEACAAHGSSLADAWLSGEKPKQVHFGVTVENKACAIERRDVFRDIPAEYKFVSYEPALELVDWTGFEFIDQLICGGESGPGARPIHPAWARAAREWCEASDVSFFFKQWGDWLPEHQETGRELASLARGNHTFSDGVKAYRVGKICAGRLLDGIEHNMMPVPF